MGTSTIGYGECLDLSATLWASTCKVSEKIKFVKCIDFFSLHKACFFNWVLVTGKNKFSNRYKIPCSQCASLLDSDGSDNDGGDDDDDYHENGNDYWNCGLAVQRLELVYELQPRPLNDHTEGQRHEVYKDSQH